MRHTVENSFDDVAKFEFWDPKFEFKIMTNLTSLLRSLSAYGRDEKPSIVLVNVCCTLSNSFYPSDNEETTHLHIALDVASLRIYVN